MDRLYSQVDIIEEKTIDFFFKGELRKLVGMQYSGIERQKMSGKDSWTLEWEHSISPPMSFQKENIGDTTRRYNGQDFKNC